MRLLSWMIGLKLFVKYNDNIKLIHIFHLGSGGTGKFHLIKAIYNIVSKSLLFNHKEAEKPCVLLLQVTRISAVNIGGTTIHSALGIKPEAKLIGLSDKANATSRNKLLELKPVMIDKIWTRIDARLA